MSTMGGYVVPLSSTLVLMFLCFSIGFSWGIRSAWRKANPEMFKKKWKEQKEIIDEQANRSQSS
jgi:hypothetical protein